MDYVDAIVQRDVRDVAQVEQIQLMRRLLRVLAQYSGQLLNFMETLGGPLRMNHVTTQKYVSIFESVSSSERCSPGTNTLKRLTKTPKSHFLDSGLLAALRDVSPDRLRRGRSPVSGGILETFVLTEILKLAS